MGACTGVTGTGVAIGGGTPTSQIAKLLGKAVCRGSLSLQGKTLLGAPIAATDITLSQAGFVAGYPGASKRGLQPGSSGIDRVIPTSSWAIGEIKEAEQRLPVVSLA